MRGSSGLSHGGPAQRPQPPGPRGYGQGCVQRSACQGSLPLAWESRIPQRGEKGSHHVRWFLYCHVESAQEPVWWVCSLLNGGQRAEPSPDVI